MKNSISFDNLQATVYDNLGDMGRAAADFVQEKLAVAISERGGANLILATGASQFPFLERLKEREIDWQKITVFHLDEYKGIPDTHPASFRKYLRERILDEVRPKKAYFLNGDAKDLEKEMEDYTRLLKDHPIDIACIGIGENGHIAFNDPPVADFNDPNLVKVVELDEACRNQQLGEGWFAAFDDVPTHALTLTVTAIMDCRAISCVVPDSRKAEAVRRTLYGPVSTECPASILRTHKQAKMFLDTESAAKI